jgi:toxin CptA
MPSSSSSSICHIDWHPSRWLAAALLGLGMMAALSLWLSALPVAARLAGSMLCVVEGVRLARRHRSLQAVSVDWLGGEEPAYLTGSGGVARLDGIVVHLRGPLASLSGTDARGHRRRLVWWPDTLDTAGRRQLRLANAVSCRSENPLRKQAA